MIFETDGLKAMSFHVFEAQALSTRGQADVNLHRNTPGERPRASSATARILRLELAPVRVQKGGGAV